MQKYVKITQGLDTSLKVKKRTNLIISIEEG